MDDKKAARLKYFSVECPECRGMGIMTTFYGGGQFESTRDCDRCNGRGEIGNCDSCKGAGFTNDVQCPACLGAEATGDCIACAGNGAIETGDCPACDGFGFNILHYS